MKNVEDVKEFIEAPPENITQRNWLALEAWKVLLRAPKTSEVEELKLVIQREFLAIERPDPQYIFLRGNVSEGFTAVGPYEDMDEAASAHDLEEGWLMSLLPPKA